MTNEELFQKWKDAEPVICILHVPYLYFVSECIVTGFSCGPSEEIIWSIEQKDGGMKDEKYAHEIYAKTIKGKLDAKKKCQELQDLYH